MKIYSIDDKYIKYLQTKDNKVFNNEDDDYVHTRKYISLGIIIEMSEFKYYIPLSSPKDSDYFYKDGKREIRKSIVPIIRMTKDEKGGERLLGTLKISNMIPVPDSCAILYDVNSETDLSYKELVKDELDFITKNINKIKTNAKALYTQKTNNNLSFNYINHCCDFNLLEEACKKYKNE